MNILLEALKRKEKVIEELEENLTPESINRARRDHHSKRLPRPCGMTIHTGIGCSLGCIYCYVPDMGFPMKPQPYPLSGIEMAYALAINPYVYPGYTLAAYGSVTEPFLTETIDKALEYIYTVHRFLGLPSQVSTKIPVSKELAVKLKRSEPRLSVLITIITIDKAKVLEPNAPHPLERIESIEVMRREGLHVTLFMRPIIPGITDREAEKIIALAAEKGVNGIVLGSLRVTPGIIRRLTLKGINIGEILKRMPRKPKSSRDQVTIRETDLKKKITRIAEDYGLTVYPSACAANIEAHGLSCNACRLGPCGSLRKIPEISDTDVREVLDYFDLKAYTILVSNSRVRVRLRYNAPRNIIERFKQLIISVARRSVDVRVG